MEKPWARRKTRAPSWSLILTFWLLSILATAAWFSHKKTSALYSYETGFGTDLGKFNVL